jgi:hypothetical protein
MGEQKTGEEKENHVIGKASISISIIIITITIKAPQPSLAVVQSNVCWRIVQVDREKTGRTLTAELLAGRCGCRCRRCGRSLFGCQRAAFRMFDGIADVPGFGPVAHVKQHIRRRRPHAVGRDRGDAAIVEIIPPLIQNVASESRVVTAAETTCTGTQTEDSAGGSVHQAADNRQQAL